MKPDLTRYREVHAVIAEFAAGVEAALAGNLVGAYLGGSLATGDFDGCSDIDFLVVTRGPISEDAFGALQRLHDSIRARHPRWGAELEGSYIPEGLVRRWNGTGGRFPCIERGHVGSLTVAPHGPDWTILLHIYREYGVPLTGPSPVMLIDPLGPEDLRQAVRESLMDWWAPMLDGQEKLLRRGYQSYAVLTMCRMLYTLEHGKVGSKETAASWARQTLPSRWVALIDRAWEGRRFPESAACPDDIAETAELIRHTLVLWGHISPATAAASVVGQEPVYRSIKGDEVGVPLHVAKTSVSKGGTEVV